jgi:CheY-like chemotaxis protein
VRTWLNVVQKFGSIQGRRVLVVEDEIIVAYNLECEIADAGGIPVGPAYSLDEALEQLSQPIDAAVLDINLGAQKVWPLAEELQRRGVPFLFASANCGDPSHAVQRFIGSRCLDKPVSTRTLISALELLLGPHEKGR